MKRTKFAQIRWIALTVMGLLLITLFLIRPNDMLGGIRGIWQTMSDLLLSAEKSIREYLKNPGNRNIDLVITGLLYTVAGGLIIAFLLWLIGTIRKRLLRRRKPWVQGTSQFPFRTIETRSILEEKSLFPYVEIDFVARADSRKQHEIESLARHDKVLLVGRTGIGKTREAVELILRMDDPSGQVLVFKPANSRIDTIFQFPGDISLRQHRVVLFLDNLSDFDAYDEENDELYTIGSNVSGFERIFDSLIKKFDDKCDDFRVIATIRPETDAWKELVKRAHASPWDQFKKYQLPNHSWADALNYTSALESKLINIELDFTAKKFLADRFDGTFASIRDFLRRKDSNIASQGRRVLLGLDDVKDFIGKYPDDWEKRFYQKRIQPNPPARAIFEALDITAQARIARHEKIVIGLASRIVSKKFAWAYVPKCRNALQELDIWISKRDSILEVPEAYVEGRGNLPERLDVLSDVLLGLDKASATSLDIYQSYVTFGRAASLTFDRHDLSLRLLRRAVELQPNDPYAWIGLGSVCNRLGLDKDALEAREQVVHLMPNSGNAWSFLASSLIKLERYEAAKTAVENAEKLDPQSAIVVSAQGMLALQLGETQRAIKAFRQAVDLYPTLAFAWTGLGRSYAKLEKHEDAIAAFSRSTELNARDPIAWSGLGMSCMRLGNHEKAEEAFSKSIELDPNHSLPWSHLAEISLEEGELEQAAKAYRRAVALDQNNAQAWSGLGHALNRLGRFHEAIEPHRKAIALGLDNFATEYGLGIALMRSGQWRESVQPFLASFGENPEGPALGQLLVVRKHFQKAGQAAIVQAIDIELRKLRPETFPLRIRAQEAANLAEEKSYEATQKLWPEVVKNGSADHLVWMLLCSACRKAKMLTEAISAGEKATQLKENESGAWYLLGRAYEDAHNNEQAEKAFKKALELWPNHHKARVALDRVSEKMI